MTDWWLVLAVFWGAYLLDGLRRLPRPALLLRRTAPLPPVARFASLHLLPPAPWAWRFAADNPPFALSPAGLCNQPVGTAGRPPEHAPFTAVWRWEQFATAEERRGWLVVNGRLFGPAAAAWPAADLLTLARELAPLPPPERERLLRRRLDQRLRPDHWRRRHNVVRARTRDVALVNTVTVGAAAAITALTFLVPSADEYAAAPRLLALLDPLLLIAATGYLGGIVLAVLTARRLRPWLRPGATAAILHSAFFPPHCLRWRRVLTDFVPPAPHPVLAARAAAARSPLREAVFETLTDLRWPLPLPELRPSAQNRPPAGLAAAAEAIRAWQAADLEQRLARWCPAPELAPAALLAPPPAGREGCGAYCPRCHSRFARSDGDCPHGIALVSQQSAASALPDR